MGLAIVVKDINFSSLQLGFITPVIRVEQISITGSSTINNSQNKSTYSISYTPLDTQQTGVSWSIVEGSSYASINSTTGEVSVLYGADGNTVVIAATSLFNPSITATKQITVTYKNDEEQTWLNRLSELKCVFYAPLNQGDLSDHISGSVGEPYNGSSYSVPSDNLTWSDINSAYLLHAKWGGQAALRFEMSDLESRFTNGDYYTVVAKIKQSTDNKFVYTSGIGYPVVNGSTSEENPYGYPTPHIMNKNMVNSSNFNYIAITVNGNAMEFRYYVNGVERTDLARTNISASDLTLISNWKKIYYDYLSLCGIYGTDDGRYETVGYFKNVYIFNKLLTTEEMIEIQNHE